MRLLVTILSVFIFSAAASQPIIPRFETIGVNEGLSQNSVYAIYQDREGFMWFGTADGLNRYDGDEIKIYKSKSDLNKRGNSNFIRGGLFEDEKHNIWFSTETGLYYYDRLEDEVKPGYLFPELKSGIIYYTLLNCDSNQTLWLYHKYYGFISWNIKTKKWTNYPYPFKVETGKFPSADYGTTDFTGDIWLNWYKNDGMLRFDTREKKYSHEFKGKNYQSVVFGKGKHYTCNENFIYRYDSASSVTDSFSLMPLGGSPGFRLFNYEDNYGRLWCGSTNQGLMYYDFTTRQLYHYRRNVSGLQSLGSNIIRSLAEDRSGNLWIGTDGAGVCKLDLKPPFFNVLPINEAEYPALKDFFIKSLYEDEKGRVWFGTLSGLNIYDPHDGSIRHYSYNEKKPHSLQGNLVSAIFRDNEGIMWIGHDRGISVFDETQNKFYPVSVNWGIPPLRPTAFINRIIQSKKGNIIALTLGQAVIISKKNKTHLAGRSEFKTTIIAPGSTFNDIIEMPGDEIWTAVPNSGLYYGAVVSDSLVIKEQFFPGINIHCIHADESLPGILWMASDKGLVQFNTKTKKHQLFSESDGMANSFVYGILEDEQHNLWMSTNGGLVYFDRKANTFQNYTVNEGLQSNEFNTGAFHKGASGTFYFGGVKGFNWFRSGNFPKSKIKPSVGITSILVQNIPFRKDSFFLNNKTIRLGYLENDILFHVAAFDYTRSKANKIQYKLEGWNDKWITTYSRQIRFSKLLPGDYTLVIRASNNAGEWSNEEKIIIFINAPFWQQTWFYILCSALLMLAVILVTRNLAQRKIKAKLQQLEKQQAVEAERNRISKDMHDEIGSGLTRIALMTELMHTQKQLDEKTKHDVNEIAGSTRQLVESMSEIIWTLNPHNDKLKDLLAYLREQTQHYFEPLNINYEIIFPDAVPDVTLSNEQRRNLFLVSKEALNNALKHAAATRIEFVADANNGKIKFSVSDNGKGIDGASRRAGANGLRNMQQRMKDINGEIEWISQNGSGTKVNYWINF